MERKFKSKLVSVKASEVRKQAIVQLKESIEISKFNPVEPIDYDVFIEENISSIRTDSCSKKLICLPADDVTVACSPSSGAENDLVKEFVRLKSLFVTDSLLSCAKRKYEVVYKYSAYGNSYKQLPGYSENNSPNTVLSDILYEIDLEEPKNVGSKSTRPEPVIEKLSSLIRVKEKQGWLNYKSIVNSSETAIKKRYFHLHQVDSSISMRNNAVDACYRNFNNETKDTKNVYVLEYFKEVPSIKRNEISKNHIILDSNVSLIKNTFNENGINSFEITGHDPSSYNQKIHHIFVADSQSKFDEWFNLLKNIILKCDIQTQPTSHEASLSFSALKTSEEFDPLINDKISPTYLRPNSPPILSKASSIDSDILNGNNSPTSEVKSSDLMESFNIDKYLNEIEEDLFSMNKPLSAECSKPSEQINLFDVYRANEPLDEENDLDFNNSPEIGRKLLLEFEHFNLNLNLPLSTNTVTSKSSLFKETNIKVPNLPRNSSIHVSINPELFYISFAIFDVRNNQKISENFYIIPNYDIFFNQLNNSSKLVTHITTSIHNKHSTTLKDNIDLIKATHTDNIDNTSLFSLDGKKIDSLGALLENSALLKQKYLKYVHRALFKIVDIHEEIYLVARIEKCLDGANVHSSIEPYLSNIQNENSRIKKAIKLHKKTQQIIRTPLANYRQPFAWAARRLYKRNGTYFELDNTQKFTVFEQDVQGLTDENLLGNLRELNISKDKSYSGGKLVEISNAELVVYLNDLSNQKISEKIHSNLISCSYTTNKQVSDKHNSVLEISHFEPILPKLNDPNQLFAQYQANSIRTRENLRSYAASKHTMFDKDTLNGDLTFNNLENSSRSPENIEVIKKARLIEESSDFKSFMYVYPKSLKYDQQKIFSKARNILIKIEFRESDKLEDLSIGLNCIFDLNKSLGQKTDNSASLSNTYYTPITYHNKNPQFYDEIKILLPVNLSERHHLFFKFYHVSCSSAKTVTSANNDHTSISHTAIKSLNTDSSINQDIETLIGYAWLEIFKNGRIISGEKTLPIAQVVCDSYLSSENQIKWVENMKPLFRVNLAFQTTVHTGDIHVANFFQQCEKFMLIETNNQVNELIGDKLQNKNVTKPILKRKAPIVPVEIPQVQRMVPDMTTESIDETNKRNDEINFLFNDPHKDTINNSIKALLAVELPTIIKHFPTLLNRILSILVNCPNNDAPMHAFRAILHFISMMSFSGKVKYLNSFIQNAFFIDYTAQISQLKTKSDIISDQDFKTIHHELISNLAFYISDILSLQSINQIILIFNNCWFFLEVALKSIFLYSCQFKQLNSTLTQMEFDADFYKSLRFFFDVTAETIVKYSHVIQKVLPKKQDFNDSLKSCNTTLALFIKKALNVLNKKFLFSLMNVYLDIFQDTGANRYLFELKFDFIRTICNHEHYIAFNLPIRKCLANINEFTELKHEYMLSDQFRKKHFLVGILLSGVLAASINEPKSDQRRIAIAMCRSLVCKHSYDQRYNDDKVKLSRIVSLYLPLIDIVIENRNRLDLASHQLTSNLIQSRFKPNRNSHCSTTTSIIGTDHLSTTTSNSLKRQAVLNSVTSGSCFNGHFLNENNQKVVNNGSADTCSLLGVIAGLGNPNHHLETVIGSGLSTVSDADSLSSIDENAHFKGGLRTAKNRMSTITIPGGGCSVSMTNSDGANMNATVSDVLNNAVGCRQYTVSKKEKLEAGEVRDLLITVVYVLGNLGQDSLLGLLLNYEESEFVEFLNLLEICLKTFKYRGSANLLTLNSISKGVVVLKPPKQGHPSDLASKKIEVKEKGSFNNEELFKQQILIEANLCHQVGLVIIKTLSFILIHLRERLCKNHGENLITKRLIEIYFYILETNQSLEIKLRTFSSLRLIISKTPKIFLAGNSILCAQLCFNLLKCFNSRFQSVRADACVCLYLIMRKNYEFSNKKSISRVHSQTIISTSQLIGTMQLSNSHQILECLNFLDKISSLDRAYQNTRFPLEVQDLTRRIKNILLATSRMKSFQDDTEMLIDSQYSLAKSYGNSVELRCIWLDSIATIHTKEKNFVEAAHCYLHIAALVSQNLKHQGQYTLGCSVFKKITPNIEMEEELDENNAQNSGIDLNYKCDIDCLNQVKYTQTQLLDYLCSSADMFKLGESYDNLPSIFKLAVAIYETNRDYEHLQKMHQNIQRAYSYMAERDQQAQEKPLGAYYRVSFFGPRFADENNKVYIYKEPSNTKLFEITDRLKKMYVKHFGSMDSVEILRDSRKPHELNLDTENKNYIQVIHVQAYFTKDELRDRVSFFEKNVNLKKFFYETPYQLKTCFEMAPGEEMVAQHADLLRLCKRKIILETSNWFPYVKKRILVIYEKTIDLNPLETAIDELLQKSEAFESILRKKDMTLLELYLQGAIIPQVHRGPLAYAEAFLEPNTHNSIYSKELKKEFKDVFKNLIDMYQKGIELYGKLAQDYNNNKKNLNGSNLTSDKYLEMHCLLQTKFMEFENTFRNLLLIDGDLVGYQEQVNKGKKLSIEIENSSSSQA